MSKRQYRKWVSLKRLSNVSFDEVEPVLIKLFSTMGHPLRYKTDNGSLFQSHNFKQFAERYGFQHRKVTPYWPRANATAETVMCKLNKVLKIAKLENKEQIIKMNNIKHKIQAQEQRIRTNDKT